MFSILQKEITTMEIIKRQCKRITTIYFLIGLYLP